MTPLLFTVTIAAISIAAGLLGSLVGVGGGIIVVPALTLLMGVDIRTAIAASIVAVVATSSGAASGYVRQRLTNMRLAMFLEVATAAGALFGAVLAAYVPGKSLYVLFGLVLCYTAYSMSRPQDGKPRELPPDRWADRLKLHTSYFDKALNKEVSYRVSRTGTGLAVSGAAGILSGLLGIGGGVLKVPVMHLSMGIPLKVCTATSNFMIGVTASTGAAVYFMRGDVQPFVTAPVAVGVLLGAKVGSRVLGHLKSEWISRVFVTVLVITAVQMLLKGFK
ncbi:MAG: sulfite exporter TauE/SafE family protein [Chthoniobacteraceae bacterium]